MDIKYLIMIGTENLVLATVRMLVMASTANCCNIQNVCSSSKTIYRDDSQLPRSHDNACVNIPAALLTGTKQVRRTMEFLG